LCSDQEKIKKNAFFFLIGLVIQNESNYNRDITKNKTKRESKMPNRERTAEIRKELKENGYNRNHVSVRSRHYSSITVEIKKADVDYNLVEKIARKQEHYRRCEYSGDILQGGNTFVSVDISSEAAESVITEEFAAKVEKVAAEVIETCEPWSGISFHNGQFIMMKEDGRDCYIIHRETNNRCCRIQYNSHDGTLADYWKKSIGRFLITEGLNLQPKAAPAPKVEKPAAGAVTITANKGFWQIAFPSIPSKEIREYIKGLGFRWYRLGKVWSIRQNRFTPAQKKELEAYLNGGDNLPPEPTKPEKDWTREAEKVEEKAAKMQPKIDEKFSPAIASQNYTARRARIAAGIAQDGERLVRVQKGLLCLARAYRSSADNDLKEKLHAAKINSQAGMERLLSKYDKTHTPVLKEFFMKEVEEFQTEEDIIRAAEKAKKEQLNEIRNIKIPGFFPTPEPLIKEMILMADLQPGDTVLEPSAGIGSIVDEILVDEPECFVHANEINLKLYDFMKKKYKGNKALLINQGDFLRMDGPECYDKIIMNPPFEKSQDIAHIAKAFNLLKPGGVLVAIASAAVGFRTGQAYDMVRDLIDQHGFMKDNPEGSFKGADSIKQTGVNTVTIYLQK